MSKGNITKDSIVELFENCYVSYQQKLIENLKCASIVDIDKIEKLFYFPLAKIGNSQNIFFSIDSVSDNYSRPGYAPIHNNQASQSAQNKKYNYSLFGNLVKDYIQKNTENLPEDQLYMLTESISNAKCLSHIAYNGYKNLINYISSDYNKNLELRPELYVDKLSALNNYIKNTTNNDYASKSKLVDTKIIEKIDQAHDGLMSFAKNYNTDIIDKAKKQHPVIKNIFSDFIIYGYLAYYINIANNKINIKHLPCGSFMYSKDQENLINLFVKSYYQDNKNKINKEEKAKGLPSIFDIYVYNYESCKYEHYNLIYTEKINTLLQKLQSKDKQTLEKIQYVDEYDKLPFYININDDNTLYGISEISRYYENAIKAKMNEFYLEYVSARIIRPAQLISGEDLGRLQDDGSNKVTTPVSAMKTDHQIATQPSQVNVVRQTDANGNPMSPTLLHQPLSTILPGALEVVDYKIKMSQMEMSQLFYATEIQKAQDIEYATNTNAKKIRNDSMAKLETISNVFAELFDLTIDVAYYDHLISVINDIYDLSQNKDTTENKTNAFFDGINTVFNEGSPPQLNVENGTGFEYMYILCSLINKDASKITFNEPKTADKIKAMFLDITDRENSISSKYKAKSFSLKVSNGIRYNINFVIDKLQSISTFLQYAQATGLMAAAACNNAYILDLVKQTEVGEGFNDGNIYQQKLTEMQQEQQTEKQDLLRETLDKQNPPTE